MKKKQVLVVGGYGSIGSTISLLLSENEELYPVVAGRNSAKAEALAKKLIPVFSILGIIALLFLIIAGILSNLEGFADTR